MTITTWTLVFVVVAGGNYNYQPSVVGEYQTKEDCLRAANIIKTDLYDSQGLFGSVKLNARYTCVPKDHKLF